MKFKFLSLFFLLILNISKIHATDMKVRYSLGAGVFAQDINKDAKGSEAKKTFVGTYYPQLSVAMSQGFSNSTDLELSGNYTPIAKKHLDNSVESRVILAGLGPRFYMSRFSLKLYPGMMFYTIKGKGGTVVQNNGLSTATFSLPADSSTAKMIFFGATASLDFSIYRLDIGAICTGLASERRTFHLLSQMNVRF